jgi:hypothetical protein
MKSHLETVVLQKASCGAVDVRSLAQLISDLASQLEVQLVRGNAQAVQLANAESKCRELVAELSAVDKIHNEAVFITDENYEQSPPEVQKMIRSLAVLQIPAYDTFLAEVRANCVESAINTVIAMMNHQHPVTSKAIDILRVHAAQLRKGAAL